MAVYTKFRNLATRLIGKYGRDVTYRSIGTTVVDPLKPWLGNSGDVDQVVKAAFTGFSYAERQSELIQTGDKKCLISSQDLTAIPKAKDVIVDDSIEWHIVMIDTVMPGPVAEPVIYKVQVRA